MQQSGGPSPSERPLQAGTITRLAAQKHDPQRVSVFIDEAFAFGLHVDIVVQFGLSKKQHLDVALQQQLVAADQARSAKSVALEYLGYRARSEWEVRRKLLRSGFAEEAVDAAIVRLRDLDYLDDTAFARAYVAARFRARGYGPLRLRSDLLRRGIARPVIDEVVADLEAEEDMLDAARQHARKRWPQLAHEEDPYTRRRKLMAYLLRRGFDHGAVRRVIEDLEAES